MPIAAWNSSSDARNKHQKGWQQLLDWPQQQKCKQQQEWKQQQNGQQSRDGSKSRDACKSSEATARKEVRYSWKSLTAEMTAAEGIIGTSWMSTAVGPPESDSRKVGIITSIEDNNIRQGHQQQQQELTTITLGTTAETTGISQTSTVEGRPATCRRNVR
jgi:hypothetical protein